MSLYHRPRSVLPTLLIAGFFAIESAGLVYAFSSPSRALSPVGLAALAVMFILIVAMGLGQIDEWRRWRVTIEEETGRPPPRGRLFRRADGTTNWVSVACLGFLCLPVPVVLLAWLVER